MSARPLEEGSIVLFGRYEQDGNLENGTEPIEWIVLGSDDNGMLLLSRYVLDCVPYKNDDERISWDKCNLRNWMNNDFYNIAFADSEKKAITLSSSYTLYEGISPLIILQNIQSIISPK